MDSSNQYLSNMNTSLITVVNLLQNEILTALHGVKTAIDEVKGEVQLLKESTKSSSVSSLFFSSLPCVPYTVNLQHGEYHRKVT